MQPGVNFRVSDKNIEQLVVVKDAGFLPFGKSSTNDPYLRIPAEAKARGFEISLLQMSPTASARIIYNLIDH